MPEAARAFATEGVRRLVHYQDPAYARLYLDRLTPIRDADVKANANGKLLAETARHLAVRMSYEDVIRVAQVKIDPARFARIESGMNLKPEQTFTVTEFLKPGVEEFCSVLPPWFANPILRLAERYPAFGRAHWGMEVNTASISGYLRFFMLAKLRRYRPKTFRYQEEQRAIEAWLSMIARAATLSADLALEIAECARLIKGYGDTHKRGTANYRPDRARSDDAGSCRHHAAAPGCRGARQRPHRGAARPRRRGAHEMSRRDRGASRPQDRRGIAQQRKRATRVTRPGQD